jgi:mannose-6-phosphate isomerase-like protein (cupin superfamily)
MIDNSDSKIESRHILKKSARFVNLSEIRKSSIDISLEYCGIEQCTPLHSGDPTIRDSSFIHIVLKGIGTLIMNGKVYKLSTNDAFSIPKGYSAIYPEISKNYS